MRQVQYQGKTMRVYGVFPFSEAVSKQVGEYVALGGQPYKVLGVSREGRNEPYFRLEDVADHWLATDYAGWLSWRVLGDVKAD